MQSVFLYLSPVKRAVTLSVNGLIEWLHLVHALVLVVVLNVLVARVLGREWMVFLRGEDRELQLWVLT